MNQRVNVTKTFLPPLEEYEEYLKQIWQSGYLTNQGPLLKDFEKQVSEYLKVDSLHLVNNGTAALQVALRSLGITEGEIITTPFSYIATTSSIMWERCKPVFVDIEPDTFCIDVNKIEAAITPSTRAIMPVHVFGFPCDVDAIDIIAKKHNLKVIYDAAHAFGVEYKGRSLLDYGDISTVSFHATKLFHTVEGGGIVVRDKDIDSIVELTKRFGHEGDDHYMLGINAKASELQAAMGLCNLKYIDENIEKRKKIYELYDESLDERYIKNRITKESKHNYSYFPVVFESEEKLHKAIADLNNENIFPRRYFYPSLNTLPYIKGHQECPISEDISRRILCLPLYADIEESIIKKICETINI